MSLDIKCLYGQNTKIFDHSSKGSAAQAEEGCVVQQIELFPGAMLVFQDIHEEHLDFSDTEFSFPPDMISIQHCKEGRFEGEYRNGECFYLGPGDLSVNLPVFQPEHNSFPLSHYHGLNIIIEPESAGKYIESIEELMGPLYIDFREISDTLNKGNHLVIYRENVLEHILSELYMMRSGERGGHIKMKVIEFLHSLCSLETARTVEPQYFNRSQVRIVKDIREHLTGHPEWHYTLEELSSQFNIPLTSMKNCFKGVYGMSIGAYLREYRLQLAAELLKENSLSIGDIAFRIGYESPSKFTEAFRKKFNCSPSQYRRGTSL